MNEGQAEAPKRLLTVAQVKKSLTRGNPDYGKDFSEDEWERITERLEALTHLFWDISVKRVRQGSKQQRSFRTHHSEASETH